MTWTPTTLTLKDAAGNTQPVVAYTDGTSYALAHPLLDATGAIVAPATAGNQTTGNAALTTIATTTANIPAKGSATSANSLPVVIASDQSGLPLPTGASTAANQSAGNASLVTVATNTANIPAKGSATSANSTPVVIASDQGALPLPTGASTSALQTTGNTSLTTIATAVQAATPAGTNVIGKVGIDQTTPGTTNLVQLPASQITALTPPSGVTANAGTNLNTSALALDTSVNGVLVSQGSTTSGQKGPLVQAAVSASAPALTAGQTSPLSLDAAGNLRVNVAAGGSGGASSGFGSAFPAAGTAVGAKNGANMVNLTADASSNLNVALQTALPAGANVVGRFTTDQTTHGTTDLVAADVTKVGGAALALGQASSASSIPVVLPAAQVTTLTPPTTVAVTQATGTNLHAVVDSGTITTVGAVTAITNALPAGANLIGRVTPNDGTNSVTIKAASTAAAATDTAQVVTLSPNTPLPAGSNSIGNLGTVTTVSAVTAITTALPTGANVIGGVTVADGSSTSLGAKADAAASTDAGTFSLIALFKRSLQTLASILTACQGATPAGSNSIGTVGLNAGGNAVGSITNTAFGVTGPLPAGTNLMGKVGIDQTTPGTTNLVQLPTPQIVTGSTTTRPADTVPYTAADVIANSTTAGSVTYPTIAAARGNDVAGTVLRLRLKKSGTTLTNAIFRVHLYNAQPSVTNGDNGVWLTTTAGYVGAFDVTMTQSFSDGAMGIGTPTAGSGVNFAPATGTQNLYYLIEARAAYTPGSAEAFTPTVEVQ